MSTHYIWFNPFTIPTIEAHIALGLDRFSYVTEKKRNRRLGSLKAIFERSDGRKLHFWAAGEVKLSPIILCGVSCRSFDQSIALLEGVPSNIRIHGRHRQKFGVSEGVCRRNGLPVSRYSRRHSPPFETAQTPYRGFSVLFRWSAR